MSRIINDIAAPLRLRSAPLHFGEFLKTPAG